MNLHKTKNRKRPLVPDARSSPPTKVAKYEVRSLPVGDWPMADQVAWAAACRPGQPLRRGGAASHLKPITRNDLQRRYGYFLDCLSRNGRLNPCAEAAAHTTPANIDVYLAEIKERLSSVTIYGSIYKLRRLTQLIAPALDLAWLTEVENDLGLVMVPRSKLDRLVHGEVLVEAGLALMTEADSVSKAPALTRAIWFRNGLMVALLATCPIRLKNFCTLELGRTFVSIKGTWWIVLPGADVKEQRPDERPVPALLTKWLERYLEHHRPILTRNAAAAKALWLSSTDGNALSYSGVESEISKTTFATLGVNISPHLFRTAAASTAAMYAGSLPHLASAVLHHTDSAVTEKHYIRATSLSASAAYRDVVDGYRR